MASEFYFEQRETSIFQALRWSKNPILRFSQSIKRIFLCLFLAALLLFLYVFFAKTISSQLVLRVLGINVLLLVFTAFFWQVEIFFTLKIKKPKPRFKIEEALSKPADYNLAELLSFEVARAADKARRFSKSRKAAEINSSALLYFLLADSRKLEFIFLRVLLDVNKIKSAVEEYLNSQEKKPKFAEFYSADFQESILESLKIAQTKNHLRIEIGDIITALSKHNPVFQRILIDSKLKAEDIEDLTWWLEYLEEKTAKRKKFWEYENLMRKGSLAKEWTAGYTITLDKFSIDWTEKIRASLPETIGHQDAIKATERVLARREANNVLLVGEPGTGRKSIIYAITKKSILGQSLAEVNYKRVVELDLPRLMAQLPSPEDFETTLNEIFREALSAGNIILVIDEFHNYVGQIARPGVIDISGILASYLHLPQFQIIAITTFAGLHQYIEQNPSVLALFEKVEVAEISLRETLLLLENLALQLEAKYKRFISYPALREIIALTERYMPAYPFPEKAIEFLDEVVVYVAVDTKSSIVLPSHVAWLIKEKTQIPVGEIETKEKEVLINLETLLHQRIINQEEAVKEISSALRRARAEISVRKGPMGVFMFLGPTGVGKTETAKALAEIYFGSEERMIRLDMSEFQSTSDIPRLLGAPGQEGLLTTPIRESPFSLLLLDEIEKAHPNILNLFLQVFDEGQLTDGMGRKVDFKSSIIIATSNAGYQVILEALRTKMAWPDVKQKLLDFLFQEGIFRPEFINRLDAAIVFWPLTKENLLDVAELLLQKLKKNLKEKGIEFLITLPLKEKIVEIGYSPVFGARQMRRAIQDRVENPLATALLKGELKRGNKVELDPNGFRLIINP